MKAKQLSKWRFPVAEGLYVNETTGEWSDGAFGADLLGPEEVGEVAWHQAPPADHVSDVEAWERWYRYLVSYPQAERILRLVAIAEAQRKIRFLRRRERSNKGRGGTQP